MEGKKGNRHGCRGDPVLVFRKRFFKWLWKTDDKMEKPTRKLEFISKNKMEVLKLKNNIRNQECNGYSTIALYSSTEQVKLKPCTYNWCCPRCSCSLRELRVSLRAAKEALGAWLVGWRRFRSSQRAPAPTQWPTQRRCYQLLTLLRPPVNLEYGMKQGKD